MKYLITAKSPDSTPIKVDGSWVVEAGSSEEAFRQVHENVPLDWWPKDSTWTVSAWMSGSSQADD